MRLALIPARGGSKRIPGKNVRLFRGRPIIAYPIESALRSGCFDEVIVSTDDPAIADLAVKLGASVPFMRSPENSGDTATTGSVVREVLEQYQAAGRTFSAACCLYATAALISAARIREACEMLDGDPCAEGLITLVKTSQPAQRALIVKDSRVQFLLPEQSTTRSQDLCETYFDAAQMYWVRPEAYLRRTEMVMAGLRRLPLVLSEFETQDINNEEDWVLAEFKHALQEQWREKERQAHA